MCNSFNHPKRQRNGGFKSEDTGKIVRLQHKYSKSLSSAENLNQLFTVLGGKFKMSAHDSDLEYLTSQSKKPEQIAVAIQYCNSSVFSDLKPPLHCCRSY